LKSWKRATVRPLPAWFDNWEKFSRTMGWEGMRFDIFVSYAREDAPRVRPLVQELRRLKYHVFFDVESIRAGENWKRRLERSIRASRVLLLC
jgi:hypothetical protein